MNNDILLFGVVLAVFLYYGGSRGLGILLGMGVVLLFILGQLAPKPKPAKRASNILEPIILESTRGPAYKIPESINMWVKPNSYPEQWWKKGMRRGVPGFLAKAGVWKLFDFLHPGDRAAGMARAKGGK